MEVKNIDSSISSSLGNSSFELGTISTTAESKVLAVCITRKRDQAIDLFYYSTRPGGVGWCV